MKIGITNLKGGVGKTTLSINLAVCFAHMGYKVCIVDTDTNQNSLQWYGAREEGLPEVLVVGTTDPKALNKAVDNLHGQHDIIIMDGTPNLSEMNTRVMMASDLLIIPTRPGAHDFRAMNEFFTRFDQVKELRSDVAAYFLINEFDERVNLHRTVRESLQQHYDIPILNTVLKSRTAYGEASMMGTGVFEHSDNKAKAEMVALTNEILQLAEKHAFIQS
ncbi:plasmid segregation oscillating ATPase ParF [Cnuella takakiae]|uniref:Plasmid segregation oscillating ATPase ParF n=1 Tax=Cnuella takakiae TaxID=1302690 RepID=A0A1M5JC14_9BACT|nr:ParA family protein [Cnuella takakiae]OLY95613.1 chromosome partitioning protein [Cnuella takakiae]SHG37915.1 plasmid segregation oscillating ATPase ParF [Cnuella takakiae]